jgi:hypothetical protein
VSVTYSTDEARRALVTAVLTRQDDTVVAEIIDDIVSSGRGPISEVLDDLTRRYVSALRCVTSNEQRLLAAIASGFVEAASRTQPLTDRKGTEA